VGSLREIDAVFGVPADLTGAPNCYVDVTRRALTGSHAAADTAWNKRVGYTQAIGCRCIGWHNFCV